MSTCLIIGGGVIGLLTARELCMAGMKVTLIDRQQTGRGSSWAGGGILSPLYPSRYPASVTRLARWSQATYPGLAALLAADTGIDPEWNENGLLILSADIAKALHWGKLSGSRVDLIESSAIARIEPELALSLTEAIWLPRIAQIRNPRLVKALRCDLEQRGVTIVEGIEARGVLLIKGQARGVETSNGRIETEQVIVCAGSWSGQLFSEQAIQIPVAPVRGQMILFRTRPRLISRISLYQGRYIIPRQDGRVLFGSTLEYTGFDKATTQEARAELHAKAVSMFPSLKDFPIEKHWAGLRPGSPNGIPFIGPHPEIEGLYFNTGHFRNGVVLGPASARLLADIILQRQPVLSPEPYDLLADRGDRNLDLILPNREQQISGDWHG